MKSEMEKPFLACMSHFHTDAIAGYELMISFVLKSFKWIYGKFSFSFMKKHSLNRMLSLSKATSFGFTIAVWHGGTDQSKRTRSAEEDRGFEQNPGTGRTRATTGERKCGD